MKKTVLLSSAGIFACALSAGAQQVQESVTVVTETIVPATAQTTLQATPGLWWIAPIASILALIIAFIFYKSMMKSSEGNDTMKEIAQHVREGAMAYLWRQYKVVIVVFAVLFLIFAGLAFIGIQNPFVPVAFLTGGFFSGLCGYIGMKTATNASARTAQGASEGLNRGLRIAFTSGAVMGLVVVGLGLIDICLWYYILDKFFYTPENMVSGLKFANLVLVPENCTNVDKMIQITTTMITFGMGASTQALFARVGGGIYTKAADVGADLVGKVEAGIPEDDPRNPATIADNVGDNVGDVAGMGADLYESYCGSILATAALGAAVGAQRIASQTGDMGDVIELITAPMIVAGIGTVLSIIGMFMVKTKDGASQKDLLRSLLVGTLGSSVLILAALVGLKFLGFITWGIFGSVIAGLVSGVVIGQATEYYTSDEYNPTQGIADQANMGAATTIIDGLAVGMYSAGIPVITITIGIICAFGFAGGFTDFSMGLYGIGFAAVGMLSTLGITLATDAYGPIADNAGGNAEMSNLPKEVRERTDALDSLGNTTAATGKGFAIGSAALTAMALLAAYIEEVKLWAGKFAANGASQFGGLIEQAEKITHSGKSEILAYVDVFEVHLMNPLLICGMFIGGMMAFVFCAMTMKAVGRAAGAMVDEVRRQFREMPGIMERKEKPDYARCVEISTAGAQREMIIPSLLAIIVPVLTGLILGVAGVIGLLAGGLVSGFLLATMLNNAGGAWDNAKKYIEKGAHGGKGSDAHKAGVIGDTVGDPCKDTSGPSLNILIKLMSMVSIVFTPVVVKLSPIVQKFLGINFN
ncbi:sodium-translocating pyrophosphatase [Lentisphaerota bacterium ZTH]|nr:sodium-translocating pyrophosphatase [Lentisphaerota bacterium]WET06834.1 sodium-translocating pyrophosphatase [Lentisphaerota bacterium ZTH]